MTARFRDDLLLELVEELADVGGRLSRHVGHEERYPRDLLARMAARLEILHALLLPTAAERYRANMEVYGSEDEALSVALADADSDRRAFRARLDLDEDGAPRRRT